MLAGYKTYIGIIITLAGIVGGALGADLAWLTASQADIISAVGLMIATWGRATTKAGATPSV
jgi:hypothetical protein